MLFQNWKLLLSFSTTPPALSESVEAETGFPAKNLFACCGSNLFLRMSFRSAIPRERRLLTPLDCVGEGETMVAGDRVGVVAILLLIHTISANDRGTKCLFETPERGRGGPVERSRPEAVNLHAERRTLNPLQGPQAVDQNFRCIPEAH